MVHSLEIVVKSRDHDISYPENLEVEKEILPIQNISPSQVAYRETFLVGLWRVFCIKVNGFIVLPKPPSLVFMVKPAETLKILVDKDDIYSILKKLTS